MAKETQLDPQAGSTQTFAGKLLASGNASSQIPVGGVSRPRASECTKHDRLLL